MRTLTLILALGILLGGWTPARADTSEDRYVQCVVGWSAVELNKGKSTDAAQSAAYRRCRRPQRGWSSESIEGVGDVINVMVQGIADALERMDGGKR